MQQISATGTCDTTRRINMLKHYFDNVRNIFSRFKYEHRRQTLRLWIIKIVIKKGGVVGDALGCLVKIFS